MQNNPIIAVIGLGYVGLPLAVEFGKKYRTISLDPCALLLDNDKTIPKQLDAGSHSRGRTRYTDI